MKKITLVPLFFLLLTSLKIHSQTELWKKNTIKQNYSLKENLGFYDLDNNYLLKLVKTEKDFKISFPNQDNSYTDFHITKTNTLSSKLQEKFDTVFTFKGISLDGSNKEIRFSYSNGYGIKGSILQENVIINLISPKENSTHEFNFNIDNTIEDFTCASIQEQQINNFGYGTKNLTEFYDSDDYLRVFQIAVSTTAEYSNYILDGTETTKDEKIMKVLTVVSNTIETINTLFEVELGITFQLTENVEQLFFFDEATDPYSGEISFSSDPLSSPFNGELQIELDNSSINYDIGHLFHYERIASYGAAYLDSICNDTKIGSGYTVFSNVNQISTLLHEIGHQLGAGHTQSSSTCSPSSASAVEPGSGSTIMSYGGRICQPNIGVRNFYFSYASIREMINTIQNTNCGELILIDNSTPIIENLSNYSIPISTPFVLEASASDIDTEDVLTYCWEQVDSAINYTASGYPEATQTEGPVFRSFPPTTSNKRYFPNLNDVADGNLTPTWEVLPSIARELNFSLTVRDNNIEVGKTTSDIVTINVHDTKEPFIVTTPNTEGTIWNTGEEVTVTWNVASTDLKPINTSKVDIYLSIDGGQSFETKILENIPNNGLASFYLPFVDTTKEARIMVKAVDNIFFSINPTMFTIENNVQNYIVIASENDIGVCKSNTASYNLNYSTSSDFMESVTLSIENLQEGLDYEFSETSFNGDYQDGINFTLNIIGSEDLDTGIYTFLLNATSNSNNIKKTIELTFRIYDELESSKVTYTYPENNSSSIPLNTSFEWEYLEETTNYLLECSTTEDFNEIVFSKNTASNNILIINELESNTNYFWRVIGSNVCEGITNYDIYAFSTDCPSVESLRVTRTRKNSISLGWESNEGGNNGWELEYGETGFTKGVGTIITGPINQSFYTVDNLLPYTNYDFYLRNTCEIGGYSESVKLESITTLMDYCGENFYDTGGEFENYSSSENYTITIYPDAIDERVKVNFDYIDIVEGLDYLYVYDGENKTNLIGEYSGNYENIEITSTDKITGALTFSFKSTSIGASGWDATVLCEGIVCSPPSNINASLITMDLISLNWDVFYNGQDSILEYGIEGFEIGTGTEIKISSLSENSYVISELIPGTNYDLYIKTECLIPDTYSDYSEVFKFSTKSTYCGGEHFYDTGGEFSNYLTITSSRFYRTTIYPDSNKNTVKAIFNYIELDERSELFVYEGTSTVGGDNIINYFAGGTHNDIEIISTHETGALTFLFSSFFDENLNYRGWDAQIFCEEIPECSFPSELTVNNLTTNSAEVNWTFEEANEGFSLEYGYEGFEVGDGTTVTSDTNDYTLTTLEEGTSYDLYLKTICNKEGLFSEIVGPINFHTFCVEGDTLYNEYIIDGSFECLSATESWESLNSEEDVTIGICDNIKFIVLDDSSELCLSYFDSENTLFPTDGRLAAYTSLYSFAGDQSSISQKFTLPNDIQNVKLNFDIKALFYYNEESDIPNNFTTELIFNDGSFIEVSKIDITNKNIILYETMKFNYSFDEDITSYLKNYESTDVEIKFSLNITGDNLIATDLMLDNVSLTIEEQVLSTTENAYLKNNITLYPQPNNGTFTINNDTDANITSVTVYDVSGKLIQENTFGIRYIEELYTINNAASGVYFLRVETDKGEAIFKTIVD